MEKKIVKKIDIHAHASVSGWPSFASDAPMITPEELIAIYDKLGVEKGVLLPLITNTVFQPTSNDEMYQIAEKYPLQTLRPILNFVKKWEQRVWARFAPMYPLMIPEWKT